MTDVIFQEVIVKTDLLSIKHQVKVPRRMQGRVYLVADQMVVASYNGIFPESHKEALLQVSCKFKFQKYANLKAMEAGYISREQDSWIFDDFFTYLEITDDYLAKEI